MVLTEGASLSSMLRVAFGVFAAFWVFVLVVLYFAVGFLMKRAERVRHDAGHGAASH